MHKYKGNRNITGQIIQRVRLENHLSLESLCDKLSLLDVTIYPSDLFLIENNNRLIKDFELIAICKVLDINMEKLKEEI